MKYLHLIWAALFRRKTRTILTLVSIVAAFLLFGLLDAVRVSFDQAGKSRERRASACRPARGFRSSRRCRNRSARRWRRCRASRMWPTRTGSAAPTRIRTTRSSRFAVSPNYLDVYPEIDVSAPDRAQGFRRHAQRRAGRREHRARNSLEDRRQDSAAIADLSEQGRQQELALRLVGIMHSTDKKQASSTR